MATTRERENNATYVAIHVRIGAQVLQHRHDVVLGLAQRLAHENGPYDQPQVVLEQQEVEIEQHDDKRRGDVANDLEATHVADTQHQPVRHPVYTHTDYRHWRCVATEAAAGDAPARESRPRTQPFGPKNAPPLVAMCFDNAMSRGPDMHRFRQGMTCPRKQNTGYVSIYGLRLRADSVMYL